ncbi:MAG: glycosyltransferase family 4 protein, partial [Leptolyngbya sp. SIO1D8]|nr:glycosyltransferase family 4 protein [Leptolyngbya sp. SIO1D8]
GEAFGIPIVEAMMTEKPVIGSNKGGIPEIIQEGITGLLAESNNGEALADSIQQLSNDAPLRKKMGKLGRERASRLFTWETIGQHFFDHYKKLVLT